jgi:tetratricopeptide (TPR) repeat protein
MRPPLRLLSVFLFCLWVPAVTAAEPKTDPEAVRLWEEGQEAMLDGETDRAISLYQKSLKLDPDLARNHLSLAAAYLEKGEDEKAGTWMESYLRLQPNHHVARKHYAELLLRVKKPRAAHDQFEKVIAEIQDDDDLASKHLVHCHARLMEIAQAEEDEYEEHLHRGIGLYWLAWQRSQLGEEGQGLDTESLLCRAAAELALARVRRPDEARPCWYLHAVWSKLAQSQPAGRWLVAAQAAAPFSYLTPAEQRDLQLAWKQWAGSRQRK